MTPLRIAAAFAALLHAAVAAQATEPPAAQPSVAQPSVAKPPAPKPLAPLVPLHLRCTGNEPGWRIDAGPGSALLRTQEGSPAGETFRGRARHLDYLDPEWTVWRGRSTARGDRVLVLTVRREACADTMADGPPFDARAVVSLPDGRARAGCCNVTFGYDLRLAPLADPAAKPADDWSRLLPAVSPAVTACVIDGGVAVASVAKAWRLDGGRVGVRLTDSRGAAHDCVADPVTRRVASVRAVAADATPLVGADEPRFLPAREAPPVIACGRVERVLDRGGRLLGWLQYGRC